MKESKQADDKHSFVSEMNPHSPTPPLSFALNEPSCSYNGPSTSKCVEPLSTPPKKSHKSVPLWQMKPLLKYKRSEGSQSRKRQKASVITSTPVKRMLEEKQADLERKDERKRNKQKKIQQGKSC